MALGAFLEKNPQLRILIFAGKGGLGKTTCSAAISYHLASKGKKVLCFSTDPQASLSDIFEIDAFGKGIIEVTKNLFLMEIDADKKIKEYQEEIKNKIKQMYSLEKIPEEIENYIDSASAEPAMYESATYDAMVDVVSKGEFDYYIFDMPPFGHGVRMISMAEILNLWIDKISETMKEAAKYEEIIARMKGEKTKENEILKELNYIRSRINSFTNLITNKNTTGFFMVITPEKLSIDDTERALKMFRELRMELSGIIINQVYPMELVNKNIPELLKNKIKLQIEYLREINQKFGEKVVAAIPMFEREPKGLKMLENVSKYLASIDYHIELLSKI
ncbi:MAG: ArsA family ATPase [Thermoproteota archaeon]|jgi:arsenite-transporting ATPase